MKKRLAVILSIILSAVSVSACGGSGSSPANGTEDAQSSIVLSSQDKTDETINSSNVSETTEEKSEDEKTDSSKSDESKNDNSKNDESKQSSADSSENDSDISVQSSVQSSNGEQTSQNYQSSSAVNESENVTNDNSTVQQTQNNTDNKPNVNEGTSGNNNENAGNSNNNDNTIVSSGDTDKTQEESSAVTEESGNDKTDTVNIGDQSVYNKLFSLDNKVTIEVTMSKSEMDKMDKDYYKYKTKNTKSPIYRKATVVITVGGKSYTIDEVGIRAKGNLSILPVYDDSGKLNLSHYKLSFNETFDDKDYYGSDAKVWKSTSEREARKNRRFATLKKLDIKWNRNYDDTYIREIYASEMFKQSGVLAQKIGLSQLKFNNNNYGVMTIYEPIDEIFLERNLPKSALGGDLYKVGWTYSPANYIENQVSIGITNEDKGVKYNFDLKTNEKTSKNEKLKNFLKVINSKPTQSQLEKVLDTDYFAKFLASYYFAGDPDDIRNNYNNHYIYFRKDNGKAIFIPYDNDRTLGITMGYNPDGTGMTGQSPYSNRAAGANQLQANPLIKLAIKEDSFLRNKYTDALKKVAGLSLWNISNFNVQYNKAKNNYQSCVKPSMDFANAENDFKFSLDGKYTSGDISNMSFSDFVTRIMKTYKTYVK